MSARVVPDTNILIYAVESDGPTPARTAAARDLVRRTGMCLSTQVLGEFCRAVACARRTMPNPGTPRKVRATPKLGSIEPVVSTAAFGIDIGRRGAANRLPLAFAESLRLHFPGP